MALKPLHDRATIKRVVVATYQSVSGAGKEAMDELFAQTRAVFVSDPVEPKKFPKRIAFNVIPQIDVFMDDGSTKEEWKMVAETKKILDPKIKLTATCVRVPVFIGHSEAVNIEFEKPITRRRGARHPARGARLPGRSTSASPAATSRPHEAAGEDATYISRIREDPTVENGLSTVGGLRQSAQGRGAERGADRRGAGQPRLAQAQDEGGVTGLSPGKEAALGTALLAALSARFLCYWDEERPRCVLGFDSAIHGARSGYPPAHLPAYFPGRDGGVPGPGRIRRPHPLSADRARLQRQSGPERPDPAACWRSASLFTFRQVIRLFREIRWVNSLTGADAGATAPTPRLLAPMATMLNAGAGARGLSTITTRAILDSIATRLDEGRELSRYLIGLLVFLGLLGTFWGLLETVHSIAGVDRQHEAGTDNASMFDDLSTALPRRSPA